MKKWHITCIFTLGVIFFALPLCVQAENLLVNPSFENVDSKGWVTYGDFAYDTDTYKSGRQSGKTWAWNYGDGLFEQFVNIIPGKKYRASVYILSKTNDAIRDNTKAWIQIEWYTGNNVVVNALIKSPPLTGPNDRWELFSTPAVIVPSGAAKAKIKLIQQAPENNIEGSCFFDDANFSVIFLI